MATIKRFEDLEIWKEARIIENKIFKQTLLGKLSRLQIKKPDKWLIRFNNG